MKQLLSDALLVTAALAYVVASVMFLRFLMGQTESESSPRIARRVMAGGAIFHLFNIVVASFFRNVCPVRSVHFTLSVVTLILCGFYLALRRNHKLDIVGAFVAPLALTFLLASRFVGDVGNEPNPHVQNAMLPLHVLANVAGEALFSLAFAAAVAYLLQERQLKKKLLGASIARRLPPLDWLDQTEHRLLLAGFPLLTLGIVTGTLWAHHVENGTRADVARAVFGYLSWAFFAGVLFLRAAAGWRGRRAAYGTIAGFSLVMLVLILYLFRSGA